MEYLLRPAVRLQAAECQDRWMTGQRNPRRNSQRRRITRRQVRHGMQEKQTSKRRAASKGKILTDTLCMGKAAASEVSKAHPDPRTHSILGR